VYVDDGPAHARPDEPCDHAEHRRERQEEERGPDDVERPPHGAGDAAFRDGRDRDARMASDARRRRPNLGAAELRQHEVDPHAVHEQPAAEGSQAVLVLATADDEEDLVRVLVPDVSQEIRLAPDPLARVEGGAVGARDAERRGERPHRLGRADADAARAAAAVRHPGDDEVTLRLRRRPR
jgi:hypothetical protein